MYDAPDATSVKLAFLAHVELIKSCDDRLIIEEEHTRKHFLNDEVASSGVDDSHMGFKWRRNPPKRSLGSNLTQKRNPDKKPSHKDSMVVMRLRVGE
jgi:hypothetical protein